jgi:hypothetical protein
MGAGSADLNSQPDHGWARDRYANRMKVAPSVGHHIRLTTENENHGPSSGTYVDGLEVGVEDQNGFVHGESAIWRIIA